MVMRWAARLTPPTVGRMKQVRPSVALILHLLAGCGSTDAADAGAADVSLTPPGTSDVARVCLMNNVCGFQSSLGLAADLCAARWSEERASGLVSSSPEVTARNARMVECARTSSSCDDYVACVRFGASCSGAVAGSCQGTIADRCSTPGGDYLPPVFDCALLGMSCEDAGEATCVLPTSAPPCDGPAGTSTCDGNTRVHCRPRSGGGVGALREPCPEGATCQVDGASTVCLPAPASCAAESASCVGDVAVWCLERAGELLEQRLDCASVARRCAPDARGIARCAPVATDCTAPPDGTSSARCDGDALEVCLEGRLERMDCRSVGRSRCANVPAIPGVQAATVACL